MNADERRFLHKELTEKLIEIYYRIYGDLGFGFLESVYEQAFYWEIADAGLAVERQTDVPVWYRGRKVGDFRADLVVERKVLIEVKAARSIDPAFEAQVLNYLRATEVEVALLMNFGPRPYFKRYAFANARKPSCVHLRSSAANQS